jgi:hypothetical protein
MPADKDTAYQEGGIFVLPGPIDPGKIRLSGRGMPFASAPEAEVREGNTVQDPVLNEVIGRLQAVEEAIRQREDTFAKGINTFTEKIIAVLVEEWRRALDTQEKKYLAEMKALLEQAVQPGEKSEPGPPPTWLGRLFDNKKQP